MQRLRPARGSARLLVAVVGLAGPALAQTAPPPPAPVGLASHQQVQAGLAAGQPAAVPTPAQAAAVPPPAAPGCDSACVRANSETAAQLCAPRVEAEAPTDFEWVSRPFAKIFQQAEAPEGASALVRYRGDSIRFLSPQKDWVRVTYECGFDAGKRAVEYVRVRLGRLDKAAPAAPAQAQQASPPAQGRAPQPGQARTAQAAPVMPASQQVATAAPVPKRIRPSEPSEIEIRQVDTRARTARP
ncbi:hypothetical protein SAMN02799631_04021 [Methylobacterium sp. 174MFSha1.1]|uniref:hypothetical protein n=1 Tax=Methylobacterium sp. 174MFSha1.1 TaxID=1502749 RepID=UPI0008EB2AA9|nr:hypothetical protein [Methylobacterium sp. 174MFSha1.1]SFV03675.1 hypothetical protein SAMN02799631_04021 [Methylobacterium sp. 174MFSha1.1]